MPYNKLIKSFDSLNDRWFVHIHKWTAVMELWTQSNDFKWIYDNLSTLDDHSSYSQQPKFNRDSHTYTRWYENKICKFSMEIYSNSSK